MTRSPSPLTKEQEQFRAKMVEEVLGNDNNGKVPMEKVVLIIWQYRDDPAVVKFMTRFVAKVGTYLSAKKIRGRKKMRLKILTSTL